MEREYDIFERLPDGSLKWHAGASDLHDAQRKLEGVQRDRSEEYFVLDRLTGGIIVGADLPPVASDRSSKCIFQIAYSGDLRGTRAKLLGDLGYTVVSSLGNSAAKLLLTEPRRVPSDIALFIVGSDASAATRTEMVDWLKANYPTVRILALNRPDQHLRNADFNVLDNGPATWLPFVSAILSSWLSE